MPLGALFDASSGPLGGMLGSWKPSQGGKAPKAPSLSPSWAPLGALLEASWAVVGASWAVLAPSWAVLGASWEPLEPSWAFLGGLLDCFQRREARNVVYAKSVRFPAENL